MLKRSYFSLMLLIATVATAAAQNFRLGMNYSELIPSGSATAVSFVLTGTDSQGSLYVLINGATNVPANTTYLVKLSQNQVVYQNPLPYPAATAMAVDPAGNVYLAVANAANIYSVVKLGANGSTAEYTMTFGPQVVPTGLAADSMGRVYIAGYAAGNGIQTTPGAMQTAPASTNTADWNAFVMRLKATGAVDYATYLGGSSPAQTSAIAVDASGSVFVSGTALASDFPTTQGAYLSASSIPNFNYAYFLVRLSADGSSLVYSTFLSVAAYYPYSLAVDSGDNAVVALLNGPNAQTVVERFNPGGTALEFSKVVPASLATSLALDSVGNIYLGLTANGNYPAMNSLSTCQTAASGALTVLDPSGNVLQSTYIPGAAGHPNMEITLGTDAAVYAVGAPSATYQATQELAGSPRGLLFVASLTQNASAAVEQLACVANAASYDSTGISGGEIVSLFGQDLGPATGAQPKAESMGFPKQLSGVEVTFNGIASPLMYAQNAQINAIAPWALEAGNNVNVCVVYDGMATNCITRPGLSAHPGVFTLDGVHAAALNQNGSFNSASNPAPVGSIVSVFATGLGPISPAQPDGSLIGLPFPANTLPDYVYWLWVNFSGDLIAETTTVNYAGPAPFEVAGMSQINFVVENTTQALYGEASFILQAGGPAPLGPVFGAGSNGFLVYVAGE